MSERKTMSKSTPGLSVLCQCDLLAVPRSSAYARSQAASETDLELMKQLDALYLQRPFYGSRRLCVER